MMMMMITRTTDGWVLFLCATDVGLSVCPWVCPPNWPDVLTSRHLKLVSGTW